MNDELVLDTEVSVDKIIQIASWRGRLSVDSANLGKVYIKQLQYELRRTLKRDLKNWTRSDTFGTTAFPDVIEDFDVRAEIHLGSIIFKDGKIEVKASSLALVLGFIAVSNSAVLNYKTYRESLVLLHSDIQSFIQGYSGKASEPNKLDFSGFQDENLFCEVEDADRVLEQIEITQEN